MTPRADGARPIVFDNVSQGGPMFCGKCGSELYPGAKFCGVCGAPAPGADGGVGGEAPETDVAAASDDVSLASSDQTPGPDAGEASTGAVGSQAGRARRRSRRRMPMALIVAIAILAIATAAAAAYLVYTQVVAPNPPAAEQADGGEAEGEAEQDAEGDAEADDAVQDAEADEGDDAASAEEAPAEEQPAAHTYDCEYFTFTVTDPSVTDLVLVSQGHDAVEPVDEWYFDLVKADGSTDRLSIKIGDDLSGWAGETPPGGGITSDGRECKLTEGADGGGVYVDDGRATLTLK